MTALDEIEDRGTLRVGLLVPYTNCNFEPDMTRLKPPSATLHSARLGGYDIDEIPGAEQMAGLGKAPLDEPIRLIAGVRPHAVLYGCTSATLTHGRAFDQSLAETIGTACGAVSITAAGALVKALATLGASRVGFASPYLGEINEQAIAFLGDAGVHTVHCHDIGRALGNYGQGELQPDEVFELGKAANHAEAEAIVLSCTDMRSVEVIDALERETGKPVVTSNQAMVFSLCDALDCRPPARAPGALFKQLVCDKTT
ncbi:MAG: Asp/Glu racemase [Pseudomonadota bacterium]